MRLVLIVFTFCVFPIGSYTGYSTQSRIKTKNIPHKSLRGPTKKDKDIFGQYWALALENFLKPFFAGTDVSELQPNGGIQNGDWSGKKWAGKWYKIEEVETVVDKKGKLWKFLKITTRKHLNRYEQEQFGGHYLFWEFILEDSGNGKFRSVRKTVKEPCWEGPADECPFESYILKAKISKGGAVSLWLRAYDGSSRRRTKYNLINGRWEVTYKGEIMEYDYE